jgi:hypothetical protein
VSTRAPSRRSSGFVLGIGLGVFTASIDPMSTIQTSTPGATPTLKDVWREMRTRSMSYAKNFAVVGLVFSTVECNIESVRHETSARNAAIRFSRSFSIALNQIFAMERTPALLPAVYSAFAVSHSFGH